MRISPYYYPRPSTPDRGVVAARARVVVKWTGDEKPSDYTTDTFFSGRKQPGEKWGGKGALAGREYDAEAKLYEYLYQRYRDRLDKIVSIRIWLRSTEGPCTSCRRVRFMFGRAMAGKAVVHTAATRTRHYVATKNKKYATEHRKVTGQKGLYYGHRSATEVYREGSPTTLFETLDKEATPERNDD